MPLPTLFGTLFNRPGSGSVLSPPTSSGAMVLPPVSSAVGGSTVSGVSGPKALPPVPTQSYAVSNVANAVVPASQTTGRLGATAPAAQNAIGASPNFTDTVSAGSDKTYAISAVSDYIALSLAVTVTATGNTATVDILNAFSKIIIYGPGGPVITLTGGHALTSGGGPTMVDLYLLAQRFNEYGQALTTVNVTNASPTSASYYIPGITLPASRGPYTIEVVANTASGFSASTTALSVTYTFGFVAGSAPNLLRYVSTASPVQPTANGQVDFGPIATIQDVPLTELFISGLIGPTDITALQLVAAGSVVSYNTSGQQIAAYDNSQLTSTVPAGVLMPGLAFKTGITLGRATTFLATFGSAPATSGVWFGYCWHE